MKVALLVGKFILRIQAVLVMKPMRMRNTNYLFYSIKIAIPQGLMTLPNELICFALEAQLIGRSTALS